MSDAFCRSEIQKLLIMKAVHTNRRTSLRPWLPVGLRGTWGVNLITGKRECEISNTAETRFQNTITDTASKRVYRGIGIARRVAVSRFTVAVAVIGLWTRRQRPKVSALTILTP